MIQYLLIANTKLYLYEAESAEAAVQKWMDDWNNPYARFKVYEVGEYLGSYGLPPSQIKKLTQHKQH